MTDSNSDRNAANSGGSPSVPKSPSDRLAPIFLTIASEDIVYLKSILESYEELGIIRTLNKDRGEIVILALPDTKHELLALLESLRDDLTFRITPPPPDAGEDWLLREEWPVE